MTLLLVSSFPNCEAFSHELSNWLILSSQARSCSLSVIATMLLFKAFLVPLQRTSLGLWRLA